MTQYYDCKRKKFYIPEIRTVYLGGLTYSYIRKWLLKK